MDQNVEKVLALFKDNANLVGKGLAVKTVGQAFLDLNASGVIPTVENICDRLKEKISLTKSARGDIDQAFDKERAPLEVALFCIENKIRSPE